MDVCNINQLAEKRCVPCEGGVPPVTPEEATAQLAHLPGWQLTHAGKRIRKDWKFKNFVDAMRFLDRVGEVAEADQHHPDLHLESYRMVWIELWTHAIGGLSENDFVLAAKIDQLPC
jgi:4a-hydroxytetrahydrobiopterin dehydratase